MQFKYCYRFIPRIAFFFAGGAALGIVFGQWMGAVIWSVFGAGFVIGGYIIMRRGQSTTERREEKERTLSELTGHGSKVGEWFLDHTLGPIFDLIWNISDSRAGKHVGGFFSVVGEYTRAAKQRLCPFVKVI
jgi:hypothetical protein